MNWHDDDFTDVVCCVVNLTALVSRLFEGKKFDPWYEHLDGIAVAEYCIREERRYHARKQTGN